jgi:hypothetical protein
VAKAAELMLTLSAPAWSMQCMSDKVRIPPPTVSGMKHCSATRSMKFVRSLVVVPHREFDRVTDVSQLTRLGFAELHSAGDMAVVDIETGNNALGQHRAGRAESGFTH